MKLFIATRICTDEENNITLHFDTR